jgi:hypothetical protein
LLGAKIFVGDDKAVSASWVIELLAARAQERFLQQCGRSAIQLVGQRRTLGTASLAKKFHYIAAGPVAGVGVGGRVAFGVQPAGDDITWEATLAQSCGSLTRDTAGADGRW